MYQRANRSRDSNNRPVSGQNQNKSNLKSEAEAIISTYVAHNATQPTTVPSCGERRQVVSTEQSGRAATEVW